MNQQEKIKELLAKERYDFQDLNDIMQILRSENGCPWDREQTHKSIRNCMIEEAYEAVEAIDNDDPVLLREELGDVLFQVVFHARLEEEKGVFTSADVVNDISEKMIHRHPHVFADTQVTGSDDALSRWDSIKTEEKQRKTLSSRLRAVPPMLPALMRAAKVCKKSGAMEGQTKEDLISSLGRQTEILATSSEDPGEALGELLLSVVKLSLLLDADAEQSLTEAVNRLISEVEKNEKASLT